MTATLIQIFEQAYHDLRPRTPLPEFEVRFYRFANINCTIRLRQGRIFVRLSDLLEGAPEQVLYAILHILIAKLHRKPVDAAHAARYRKYTGSHAMAQKSQLIRQLRGRRSRYACSKIWVRVVIWPGTIRECTRINTDKHKSIKQSEEFFGNLRFFTLFFSRTFLIVRGFHVFARHISIGLE